MAAVSPTATPLSAAPVCAVRFVGGLRDHGDRVALVEDGADGTTRAVTYDALANAMGDRARDLASPDGARRLVMVALDRTTEAVTTYLAALAAGHVVLLAPASDREAQRGLIARYDPDVVAERIDADWAVTPRRAGSAHALHHDLAILLSTSGSTGSPKLVRLSAPNLQANADSIVAALDITADHRAVSTLPLTYSYGLSVLHSHLSVGASVLLTERSVVDAPFWDAITRHEVTTLPAVPHTVDLLDRVGFDRQRLPRLAHVTVAGGRLAPERVRRYAALGQRLGYNLHVMYGQTEATARITTLDPSLANTEPDSIGRAYSGWVDRAGLRR